MAVEDEWPSAIHGCKEDGKSRRLDEDKRHELLCFFFRYASDYMMVDSVF